MQQSESKKIFFEVMHYNLNQSGSLVVKWAFMLHLYKTS